MMKKQPQQKSQSAAPVFADACGNTFLIFDCLHINFTKQKWERIKTDAWSKLNQAGVDDALILEKVFDNGVVIKLKMHVIEPDCTEALFCGNGARAVGKYLYSRYGKQYRKIYLVTNRGEHALKVKDDEIFVEMKTPKLFELVFSISFEKEPIHFQFVDCVEPHLVTDNFFDFDKLQEVGRHINTKFKRFFPGGISVNCFKRIDDKTFGTITYERGLYRITKSCGTGSTSCLAAAMENSINTKNNQFTIEVPGGELIILKRERGFWLGGPVFLR